VTRSGRAGERAGDGREAAGDERVLVERVREVREALLRFSEGVSEGGF